MVKVNEIEIATILTNDFLNNIKEHDNNLMMTDNDFSNKLNLEKKYKELFISKFDYYFNILTQYNYE